MIVDMVRNDLGRIAKIGSVHVPELFNTERYPTPWQMTSTVTAKTSASLAEIFSALFPSAFITGAPEVGTMRIISEIETTPRRIYTGSIGYISPQRIRLFLNSYGALNSEVGTVQLKKNSQPLKVCLAREPIDTNNVFLFHKTTHREIYESARKDLPDFDDVLLYNERGELTEFTIGNLVFELESRLYTPLISCGLLAGTFRAHLVETSQIVERMIRLDELKDCTKLFMVNSVRKWQAVHLIP